MLYSNLTLLVAEQVTPGKPSRGSSRPSNPLKPGSATSRGSSRESNPYLQIGSTRASNPWQKGQQQHQRKRPAAPFSRAPLTAGVY